ncbi:MAG: S41 family peptidase [Bacteroidales bacterium]|nr:S41 family peptidase [Bacteroidales bacterium]
MKLFLRIALFSFIALAILSACEKDIPIVSTTGSFSKEPLIEEADEISQFVYEGLQDAYLWYDKVDKLGNDYFATTDDYYSYLNGFETDYESLFYDLLYQHGTIDRWSWIVDDWEELENSFAGISKSMGYDFRLVILSGSDDVFGYIRYVLPDSPAATAGLKRGNLFKKVDGEQLTINNYRDLLFNNESYYLTLAYIDNNTIYNGDDTPVMTAEEIQENPVYYTDVIDVGGVPTAYLVYNSFTSNFDIQLNEAFDYFKSQGAGRLILDLRYNGGGSIRTSQYLASMIYSTDTDKVFAKSLWNDKYTAYFIQEDGEDALNYYFKDIIYASGQNPETPITSMELNKVYVITTGSTASASEMVINGLEPYIDVKVIGSNSTGKYVGSITYKDWDSQGNVNPDHKWAMQPIVLKLVNSAGNPSDMSDPNYINGLPTDMEAEENYVNLQPFGDVNEPLLKATIDYILGVKSAPATPGLIEGIDYEVIADSRDFKPLSKEMYLEGTFRLK